MSKYFLCKEVEINFTMGHNSAYPILVQKIMIFVWFIRERLDEYVTFCSWHHSVCAYLLVKIKGWKRCFNEEMNHKMVFSDTN